MVHGEAKDPAVRSIQIASALLDRLGELLREEPNPGARLLTALGGRDVLTDELELRLGEAQQISPEIWRHLDDAANALKGRGIDLAAYDEIRANQNPALLASTNIDVQQRLESFGIGLGVLRVIKTKTVTWDAGNFASGIAACALLERSLPEVDWASLDRADREQIASVGSLRSARWKGIAKWVAIAACVGGLAIGARFLFMRAGSATNEPAKKPDDIELREASRLRAKAHITELTAKYQQNPCDKDTMRKLTAYIFADGQEKEANAIEEKFARDCGVPDSTAAAGSAVQ